MAVAVTGNGDTAVHLCGGSTIFVLYIADILCFLILTFSHEFKTAEPLLHGQRVGGGVEFAIKIRAYRSLFTKG